MHSVNGASEKIKICLQVKFVQLKKNQAFLYVCVKFGR